MEPLLRFLKPAMAELDREAARDRYRGALLGLAVGNALGDAVEGLSAAEIAEAVPGGVRDIEPRLSREPWDDDTAQAIELAECLLADEFEPDAFLERLVRWMDENGRGIGRQTREVLVRARAGARGTLAAWAVWEQSGRQAAGNGAVMRCAPVALRWRRDPVRLIEDAGHSARVTHYDPRCVWTTTAVCAAIAHALAGTHWTLHELADGLEQVGAPEEVVDAVRQAATAELAQLDLDEGSSMGYTLKAMSVGLWGFINAADFETTLLQIVNAGGDTDTNGAVAGAVLGARFGAAAIPERWLSAVRDRAEIESLGDRLLDAAEQSEPAPVSELTRRLRPVLYLDVEAALLHGGPEADAYDAADLEAEAMEMELLDADLPELDPGDADPLAGALIDVDVEEGEGAASDGAAAPGARPAGDARLSAAAVEGAGEFLRWATGRFDIALYTRLAPRGSLDTDVLAELARVLGVEPALLEQVTPLRWRGNRLDVIDLDEERGWWWVGGAPREAELEVLRLMGFEDRWIDCDALCGGATLAQVRRILEERSAGYAS